MAGNVRHREALDALSTQHRAVFFRLAARRIVPVRTHPLADERTAQNWDSVHSIQRASSRTERRFWTGDATFCRRCSPAAAAPHSG